ncbi:MAG TPA: protein kinase [Pirellulales bacterium]|nr:protein kinase [Pirellulales bacterium]
MAEQLVCPDKAALERLVLGFSHDNEFEALEKHLLSCDHCCEFARSLPRDETLAGSTRSHTQLAALVDDEIVRQTMERLKSLLGAGCGSGLDETISAAGPSTDDVWGLDELLDPPQAEGELGWFGGYRVLRVLGAGGMGLVFEAEDPQLRRRVALKVMQRKLAARPEHRQRFLREARAAAALDHPHIVTVHQVGEHRGVPFLAMQLLRGESLDERLRREGRLPPTECLRIGRETAEALAVAHERGMIHRDIKPANIWLESPGGWVKLVDFGLAHVMEDEVHLTQTGAVLGTPAYMSPEQARGDTVDARSDLFSFGAVMYQMATGVTPFPGGSTMAILTSLAVERPKPPRELNAAVPAALSELIVRLLAKHPGERPAAAQHVAQALQAIEASPQSASDEYRRRRPSALLVGAAVAAVLLAAGIVVIVRDKSGEIIERREYPDDAVISIESMREDQRPPLEQSSDGADSSTDSPADQAASNLAGAASLDQWLANREVLTVAQDGSGQFTTIQAALAALRPGQAVEVLDRGPYRETLGIFPPRDTGLVSRHQTIVQWMGKRKTLGPQDTGRFHYFGQLDRFRLSGLAFVNYDLDQFGEWEPAVMVGVAFGATVENCWFQGATADRQIFALQVFWTGHRRQAPCLVRECLFDGQLNVNAGSSSLNPEIMVEHNWFRDMPRTCPLEMFGKFGKASVRGNIMTLALGFTANFVKVAGTGELTIAHNTMPQGTLGFFEDARGSRVAIEHNILAFGIGLNQTTAEERSQIAKSWRMGRNRYLNRPLGDDVLEPTNTDEVGDVEFISSDAADRNYLRVSAGDSTDGAEAEQSLDYAGAFAPGPAASQGDWFTQLRQRWPASEGEAGPAIDAAQPQ